MTISINRLILYVMDVKLLKAFYLRHFEAPVIEEIEGEWVVFQYGALELGLHLAGPAYRTQSETDDGVYSNAKFVFTVPSGLPELRERLLAGGVAMHNLKRYEGFPMLFCDGEDPEGNIFQLSQPD